MNLLQMSAYGAVMIVAIIIIRAIAINRLPKLTFIALWGIVLLRLLVPFSFPSALSAYSLVSNHVAPPGTVTAIFMTTTVPTVPPVFPNSGDTLSGQPIGLSPVMVIWLLGMAACALFFAVCYYRCHREFRESLPVKSDFVTGWLAEHKLARTVQIRQSSRIAAPLTYGVLRPVILMPKGINWEDTKQIEYILIHELIHIRRFDAVTKLLLTGALCVHWFNPLVWVMYLLSNRDMELSCDETVVHAFGDATKSAYARTLISMEEKKSILPPLCNNFSKNAIEERITAIMKIKKTSAIAVMVALLLVVGVTTAFATSASTALQPSEGKTLGDYERQKLSDFRFSGYEQMTVAEYQQRAWMLRDTDDYMDVLERIGQNNMLYRMRYNNNNDADFLFNVLEPLTAENWQSRDFENYLQLPQADKLGDAATLEYNITLIILDANSLTVGQYNNARQSVMDGMHKLVQGKSNAELQDESSMAVVIETGIAALQSKWESPALQIEVTYNFKPLTGLLDEELNVIKAEWDRSLAPYLPFGITYECNEYDGQAKLYWNGTQIRGIYDEVQGVWISNSAGNSTFDADTKELFAVYTNNVLTGLREATPQEQLDWDNTRNQPSSRIVGNDFEPRPYPHATDADYRSLLKLKTADYQSKSVVDFNASLLEWANEDYDRNERVNLDRAWNDFAVTLTDEERAFVTVTAYASGEENAKLVQSEYTGRAKEDPILGNFDMTKEENNRDRMAFANLFYQLSYHIVDENKLTVGERDRALAGVIGEIQQYWDSADIDTLLTMNESSMLAQVKSIAAKYSTEQIKLSFRDGSVHFESMSEPNMTDRR